MGDSGDIEILEKQVSLLRDLLGKLDRRRDQRDGDSGDPPRSSRPPDLPQPGGENANGALRLVREQPPEAEVDRPEGRRPRFREKRSWNLLESAAAPAPPEREESPPPPPSPDRPPPRAPRRAAEGESVPVQLYDQLLRERDDLLVQVMRQHAAEQRLLQERAAGEGKDQEIRRLREELRRKQTARFDDLLDRLYRRLVEVEELERALVRRAVHFGPAAAPAPAPAAAGPPDGGERKNMQTAGAEPGAKKLLIRGHEIVVTTSRNEAGGWYSFALLILDGGGKEAMKGFKATADTARESELQCIDLVLRYLEQQTSAGSQAKIRSSRNLANIRGREVDIFCDMVGAGNFQAFPFLYDAQGGRHIILRFHLEEAVTADTPEEARIRCVRRLESYFDAQDAKKA